MGSSPAEERSGKYTVQILVRAVAVLEALAGRREPWTLDELSATLEIAKASLLRMLRTLEDERMVLRDGDAYQLGPRVLDLSHGYLCGLEVTDVARPHLHELAQRTGQTISLAVLDGFEVVYVAIERAQQEIGIQGVIGGRHPAHSTALGKVLLAGLAPEELKGLLDAHALPRLTHRTITDPEALVHHLDGVARAGYAVSDEERVIGIRCIAAPVRRADGRVFAAISIAGPIFQLTDDLVPQCLGWLLEATAAVSERFGYQRREPVKA